MYRLVKEYVENNNLIVLATDASSKSYGGIRYIVPAMVLLDPKEIACLIEVNQ